MGNPPSADDFNKKGQNAFRSGEYNNAVQLFTQAGVRYQEAGDRLMAAEMANNRSVAFLKAGDAPSALAAALGTEKVFALAGDLKRQALALGNQAAAYEAQGQLEEALEIYQQSSDLLKQIGDTETRAIVLKSMSALQLKTGKQLQAMATMNAALQNSTKLSFKERLLKKLLKVPFKFMG